MNQNIATDNIVKIATPVGRYVGGNPFKGRTTDKKGKLLVYKDGTPRQSFYVALAIPKTDPNVDIFIQQIKSVAASAFPQLFPGGQCIKPDFAFKYTDGDSVLPNEDNIRPRDRKGWPGCWIFHLTNSQAPKFFNGDAFPIAGNPEEIKPGYFIRAYIGIKGNGESGKSGVYLNLYSIQKIAIGEEIIFQSSGEEVFKNSPITALPAGASISPVTMPHNAGIFAASIPAGVTPPTIPNIPPAHDFLTPKPGMMSAPVVLPPPPPAAPVPPPIKYAVSGSTYIAEELKGFGWSDAQIAALPRA
jgi:hypothetical protein